jgi:hypothetical protein
MKSIVFALVITSSALAWAGQSAQQRDTSAVTPTPMGTASVSGSVILPGPSPAPVRRAIVTLSSADGQDHRSVVTDDTGQFRFTSVPAGRYSLEARKAAHLTVSYGARRLGRPGTSFVVAEGQAVAGMTMTMPRGGVIAGRLTLESGDPLPNTQVMAIPTSESTIGGMMPPGSGDRPDFRTDDDGEFRIYGLSPDSYLLAAYPEVGRGEAERGVRDAYDAAVAALQKAGGPFPSSGAAVVAYAPTYFPGTAVSADAAPIVIAAGDVKTGLSMTVAMVRAATVSGTVVGSNGQPTEAAQVSLDLMGPPLPISQMFSIRSNRPDARGHFSFANVPPGVYRVSARGGGVTLGPQGVRSVRNEDQTDWAQTTVQVHGDNVEGVTLSLQPGMELSGRLTSAGPAPAPATWTGARVTVRHIRPVGQPISRALSAAPSRTGVVEPDGAFRVTGLTPGESEVVLTLPGAMGSEWAMSAIEHNKRDLRDAPLTFDGESFTDVNVVMTTQRSALSGRLTSESGAPATDYYVVAFPADRALWHSASPRLRVMRPAADGAFSTRDLPPGTYRLAALTDVEPDEHRRAEFLESIYEAAITVTVTAGTVTRQDVRIK